MGRQLKRVPMDFSHPINEIWPGYDSPGCDRCNGTGYAPPPFTENDDISCGKCLGTGEDISFKEYDPPSGEGYQLWENTTEGSPQTPVFSSLEDLSQYCESNVSVFGSIMTSKEEWLRMLSEDTIVYKTGNFIFI